MTDMKTKAQAIVGAISTTMDKPMNRIEVATAVLRCLIDECSESRGTGRVDKKHRVVSVKTLMKLADELEELK